MPFYEYRCGKCGTFPIYKSFDEERPAEVPCPQCKGQASRIFSSGVVVHFHAEGFSRPRIDPWRTRSGQKPDYAVMEEKAMENAERDSRAGIRED